MANFFDKIVEVVNPKAGFKRAQYRKAMKVLRDYESASKGRRTNNWISPNQSANEEIKSAGTSLRDRARDVARNTPQGKAIKRELANNTIGTGIVASFKPAPNQNGKVSKPSEKLAKSVSMTYTRWANSVNADADRVTNFYGLQQLAFKTMVEAGEVLAVRVRNKDREVPFSIRLLEPEYLDDSQDKLDGSFKIEMGKQYRNGNLEGYWLFDRHPDEEGAKSSFYKASEVAHVYEIDRPGQTRGVSWMHAVLLRLRDFNEYEDAQLMRQKLAACFMAFVYDPEATPDMESGNEPLIDRLQPASVEVLPAGKSIDFANPPGVDGYGEYRSGVLHDISSGVGMTYEALTGDFSQVNYSSARMGWLQFQNNIDSWRWMTFVPQFLDVVMRWFSEAVELSKGYAPEQYTYSFTPPRRQMLDPSKEVRPMRDKIRAGLISWQEAIRELGYDDPQVVINEIAENNKQFDELGIVLDSDARKTSAAGLTQGRPAGTEYVE